MTHPFRPARTLAWLAIAMVVCAGCHAQNPVPSLWPTATRVPPPTTSSYGKAASYYPKAGSSPTGTLGIPASAPGATTPLAPPPPTVPATGARPSTTTGAASWPTPPNSFDYPPSAAPIPNVPPTTPPTVPPTYLSAPARVDTLIQPAMGQYESNGNEPSGAPPVTAMPPANNLRWGVR